MKKKTEIKEQADPKIINQVIQWILQANSDRHIRAALKEKYPQEDPEHLIEEAVKEITAIGKEDQSFTHGWALAATRELTRKMIEVGDFANALRGIKQAAQLADSNSEGEE